jgi:hypothetical protein
LSLMMSFPFDAPPTLLINMNSSSIVGMGSRHFGGGRFTIYG